MLLPEDLKPQKILKHKSLKKNKCKNKFNNTFLIFRKKLLKKDKVMEVIMQEPKMSPLQPNKLRFWKIDWIKLIKNSMKLLPLTNN